VRVRLEPLEDHRFDDGMVFLEEAVTAPYGEAHWT
jgi:hypothetical protein